MGKKKKLDKFQKKVKKSEVKKLNPFEIKVNKQKHHILGRKLPKHEAGIPGVSRSKANKKRKNTLLQEYLQRFKDNQVVDKRIGENDANLSYEEKMAKRFVAEKQKYLDKRNIFSLNDEEDLTHYGQSLSEIDTFEDPLNSDDEDYDGRITGKMIAEEHFGGGFLSQTKGTDDESKKKPWKERMEELITQSRKEKMEQQQVREETIRMTEQINSEWKTLRFLMSDSNSKGSFDEPKRKVDDYDMNVRSLVFEARAMASNKMKSEKELAQEEMERLAKLEKDRLLRMKAPWEIEKQKKRQFISADALGDEQFLQPVLKDKSKKEDRNNKKSVKFSDDIDFKDDEEEKEDDEDNDDEDDDEDDDDDDGSDDEDDDEKDSIKHYSDDDDDDDDDDKKDGDDNAKADKSKEVAGNSEKNEDRMTDKKDEDDEEADAKKMSEISEKAKKELPFVFKVPKSYEALKTELDGRSANDQITIIERMVKCNHPSLGDGNKTKLEKLFTFVLTFYMDVCKHQEVNLWLVDRLVVKLFQLAQFSSQPAATAVLAAIKAHQSALGKTFPGLDTLLLLKLIPILYPASDFRHFVCTPAMIFMSQILSQCLISCERDVAAGLFISTILLQCVSMSKRYIPEVMNFLYAVLTLATVEPSNTKSVVFLPPFQISTCPQGLLRISEQAQSENVKPLKLSWLLIRDSNQMTKTLRNKSKKSEDNNDSDDKDEDDLINKLEDTTSLDCNEFRLSAIHVAVGLLKEFSTLYSGLPSFAAIFQPITTQLNKLPTEKYPPVIQEQISKLMQDISAAGEASHSALVQKIKKKTISLQLFQPKIEQVKEGYRKKSTGSAEENERKKLLYKVKQESKGAIREIKKDAQFLAKHQLEEQKMRDMERKRKVKALYSFMETQEADYKKMKRTKEKMSK
ncbi:nucleolar protein 14 [Octopus bimaculoides]|uniref:Nucleolar protein 14 n=1 Tax=Octopus bimaculoides TaxID=37653 RepID=A0A0L8GUX6_OCTBM|nr:nucleolar protein 14 [Octopus bimaculoides]|eukprot:XP_014778069.1 PREDICTED: nucleolar protein 14-like [Octopus bimaculoides]